MEIDFVSLFRAFWEKRLVCPLTSCEADMYWYLLKECGLGNWANPFKLPTKKCEIELDFSRRTISSVRNSLQQKGFIKFKPSKTRGEIAQYEIVNLDAFHIVTQSGTQNVTQSGTQNVTQSGTQNVTQSGTQNVTQKKKKERKASPTPPLKEINKENLFDFSSKNLLVLPEETQNVTQNETQKLFTRCRKFFEEFYSKNHKGEAYYFGGPEIGMLSQLLKRIAFSRKQNGQPTEDDNIYEAFVAYVEASFKYCDKWVVEHFTTQTLCSKYNEIRQMISNQKQNAHGNRNAGWSAPTHEAKDYDEGFKPTAKRAGN